MADAKIIHRGGIPPLSSMNKDRVFAFIAIGNKNYEYDNTFPVILPPWAQLERVEPHKALCGHLGCDAMLDLGDLDLVKRISCGDRACTLPQHVIQGTCSACHKSAWNLPDPHTQTIATEGVGSTHRRCPAPYHFLMPVDGATWFATCESLHQIPIKPCTEPTPEFKYCPMSQSQANGLPPVDGANSFLRVPPGSLVVSRGGIAGMALPPSDDSLAGVLEWFASGRHHDLLDVAIVGVWDAAF